MTKNLFLISDAYQPKYTSYHYNPVTSDVFTIFPFWDFLSLTFTLDLRLHMQYYQIYCYCVFGEIQSYEAAHLSNLTNLAIHGKRQIPYMNWVLYLHPTKQISWSGHILYVYIGIICIGVANHFLNEGICNIFNLVNVKCIPWSDVVIEGVTIYGKFCLLLPDIQH